MNDGSIIGHITELHSLIQQSEPADRTIAHFFASRHYLGSRDRRIISNTVYGLIRHKRLVETLAGEFMDTVGPTTLPTPAGAASVAAVALYGLLRSAIDPGTPERDGIGGATTESSWNFFLPGIPFQRLQEWVAGRASSGEAGLDSLPADVRYSFPDWMAAKLRDRFGAETDRLLAALNEQAPVSIRVNTLLATREECADRLRAEGIECAESLVSPHGLRLHRRFNRNASAAFRDGWFELQDEGSQLIGISCGVKPGDVVIDLCAGSGGKSLHLAAIMQNQGQIVAMDNDPHRLSQLKLRATRAKCGIITIRDAKTADAASADVVLVDAPCSGSGTIRRNPFLKWNLTPESVERYPPIQMRLLERAAALVRPGGRMVYATCSLFPSENTAVVRAFLSGRSGFAAAEEDVWLTPHTTGTDGFFIAALTRTGLTASE